MGRVIRVEAPTQVRHRHRRTIAEIMRRLMEKSTLDAESKDMAATLVFLLRDIQEGVEQSAKAWEKRDYWMKAERFLRDWEWTAEMAANIEDVIRHDALDLLPELLADLFPYFSDIQVKTMTRKPEEWRGNYARLMAEPPGKSPWDD
jgi:hypothetical protein